MATSTAVLTLIDFLLARIAEDEDAVCAIRRPPMWQSRIARLDGDLCQFVARQHPDRVLAECEAKRRIVERLTSPDPHLYGEPCHDCATLYDLAAVYSDHPDYRDDWRA